MMGLNDIQFAQPYWFLLIPVLAFWLYRQAKKPVPALRLSLYTESMRRSSWRIKVYHRLVYLRYVAYLLFVVALARPQKINTWQTIQSEGLDIVLSIDISGSMLAEDFSPNRLEAAKKMAAEFSDGRIGDRIGLVIFSGESFSLCPLTTDTRVVQEQLASIKSGQLDDGTAIGMGLATAVDRLRMQKTKSKIIILLTDGVNNAGLIDPITALDIAKAYGIKIYTIGVGTRGEAPFPVQDEFGNVMMQTLPVQIDETLLQKMAVETGGKYFRATDNNTLKSVYAEIDRLEKTKMDISTYRQEQALFFPWLLGALICLLLQTVLSQIVLKVFP